MPKDILKKKFEVTLRCYICGYLQEVITQFELAEGELLDESDAPLCIHIVTDCPFCYAKGIEFYMEEVK